MIIERKESPLPTLKKEYPMYKFLHALLQRYSPEKTGELKLLRALSPEQIQELNNTNECFLREALKSFPQEQGAATPENVLIWGLSVIAELPYPLHEEGMIDLDIRSKVSYVGYLIAGGLSCEEAFKVLCRCSYVLRKTKSQEWVEVRKIISVLLESVESNVRPHLAKKPK